MRDARCGMRDAEKAVGACRKNENAECRRQKKRRVKGIAAGELQRRMCDA